MRKKKILRALLWGLLVILVGIIVYGWVAFGPFVKGAMSVQKLDEGLYYMEYAGDDGFDKLLEVGGGRTSSELAGFTINFLSRGFYPLPKPEPDSVKYGCSSLVTRSPEGEVLMGRNFDFPFGTGLIMHCRPRKGYESISTFNLEFFGFGEGWKPEGFVNQYLALAGLFFALDGINEKGLAVADLMAGDNAVTHQETGKPAMTTTTAIPYLLKRAATVDEAIKLLQGIDMHSDIGSAHHYAIADASGRSVVVEYVDDRIVVVESPIAANHYLCDEKQNVGLADWDIRFEWLSARYAERNGVMDRETAEKCIQSVSQYSEKEDFLGTAWTMLMDLTNPSVVYWSRRQFDKPFEFTLGNFSR